MKNQELRDIITRYEGRTLTLPPAPVPFIKLEESDESVSVPAGHLQATATQPFEVTKVLAGTVSRINTLAEGEDIKPVYDVELGNFGNTGHRHWPGDTIGILTYNLPQDVDYLVDHLGLQHKDTMVCRVELDQSSSKKAAKVPPFVPRVVNYRRLFGECLDLRAVPKKSFLRGMAPYATDMDERRFLEILCSKEGTAEYEKYILKQGKGFLSILRLVPSCKLPVTLLVEHLPRLMPRPYSIASAYREEANPVIRILFSHNTGEPGITTTYLRGVQRNAVVHFYFRHSSEFVYKDSDFVSDIVMIGTGTGISPYLAFLEQRAAYRRQGRPIGRAELIVGFRYRDRNYLCQEEILQYQQIGVLDACHEAFSRDGDSKFKYVQDFVAANKVLIERTIDQNGIFFLCGDAKKFLPQVSETLTRTIGNAGQCTESSTNVNTLKVAGKYREDVWL
ncbi:methionine synthase reductase-like [Anopheles cruzii]|uniref:methionine synthase reductase-like n=1 Tax=Anopheles cruzii TaxID=68878 RepID=UPI0022EC7D9E|nr:methionine synthase reductase-like [Anopheles cruzii]